MIYLQIIDAESTRSQFLIKCQMDGSLEDGDYRSKLVGVQDDMGDGSVNAEVKS
jgi:hypothetical protein